MTRVYAWVSGESANLGDSVLRRPYLREFSRASSARIWVRSKDTGFLAGLAVPSQMIERSFLRWYLSMLISSIRTPTVVVLNAGEINPSYKRAPLVAAMGLAARLAVVGGGSSVWVGAEVRSTNRRVLRALYSWVARSGTHVRWRDRTSAMTTGVGGFAADWAFAEGAPIEQWVTDRRSIVAVVMRGDRPKPSDDWFDWVKQIAEEHDLRPVVVVQVISDRTRAHEIAAKLGAAVLDWPESASHPEQEERVRAVYAGARLAIGDRLHGLIVAATEGAVPLAWVEAATDKATRHFDAVGLDYVGKFAGTAFSEREPLTPAQAEELAERLRADVERIREELERECRVLSTLLRRNLSRGLRHERG
jgi:hypothetical protein